MAKRSRTFETVVLVLLITGAAVFLLMLAGVGSSLLTNPVAYRP